MGSNGVLGSNNVNFWWTGSNYILYVDTTQVWNSCDRRIKQNVQPMRSILDRLCTIPMIEYNYIDTNVFKNDGKTHIGLFADELEDAFPEYEGSLVLGDRNDVDDKGNVKAQSITIKFEFLLMKAIQELNEKIVLLENRINSLEKNNISI